MKLNERKMPAEEFWTLIDVMAVLYDLDRESLGRQLVRFDYEDADDDPIPMSDDGFLYLRAGIVTRGRATVKRVLADPTELARGRWPECGDLLYVAEEIVGDDIDTKQSYETASNHQYWSESTQD